LAQTIAGLCNNAGGPVKILVPMKGFSAFDHREGPLHDPEAPGIFLKTLAADLDDKTGLEALGRALAGHGIDLVSTGGTADALRAAGLKVMDVSDLTGFPEMMDGRVKTLHPMVHGGILACRDNAEHTSAMEAHGIAPIDLVIINLYPFEKTVAGGAGFDEAIENIDIGGPALIRAAAKNHAFVAVLTAPEDYDGLIRELDANQGATTLEFRKLSFELLILFDQGSIFMTQVL